MKALLNGINAIVFDLGNVIIDLHYDKSANELATLSGYNREGLDELLVTSDLLKSFEVGGISEYDFRYGMCELLGITLPDQTFDRIWNALLGEISKQRIDRLITLKESYKTFVLSNTNSIHLRCFDYSLNKVHGYAGVHELVHQAYYSHVIRKRKPNKDIYESVLDNENLNAEEVLFIDDREDNIAAAKSLGIKTFLNKEVDSWLSIFN